MPIHDENQFHMHTLYFREPGQPPFTNPASRTGLPGVPRFSGESRTGCLQVNRVYRGSSSSRGHRKFARNIKPRFPVLYPILDAALVFRGVGGGDRRDRLRGLVRELAAAGVEILQYRNKQDDDSVVAADLLAMREAAGAMRLILNDRAALAAASGCDGVHVGQHDLSPVEARQIVGHNALVGVSTHSDVQVIVADREPVDYIAIGPVFATSTKSNPDPVIGIEGVARARELTEKPLVAIGGIPCEMAPAVYDAGADSVAVVAAIFSDPKQTPSQCARDFLDIFK